MTEYGLKLVNASGVEMISTENFSYVVRAKGTVTTGSPPSDGNWDSGAMRYASITMDCICPTLFVRCTTARAAAVCLSGTYDPSGAVGNSHTWGIYTAGTSSHTVEYWMMDLPAYGHKYGETSSYFEMHNGAGRKTFDATMRCLKNNHLTGELYVSGSDSGDRGTISRPSGRVYAHSICIANQGMRVSGGNYYNEHVGCRHDGSTLHWGAVRGRKINSGGIGTSDYLIVRAYLNVIDVTDL